MDDENPKEVTADAIVTVTVTLIRRDMYTLFGDDTVKEATQIVENGPEEGKKDGETANETATAKRPAWMKQKKGMFAGSCLNSGIVMICSFQVAKKQRKLVGFLRAPPQNLKQKNRQLLLSKRRKIN